MKRIGIIGGTGLDDPEFLQQAEERLVDTPYGVPSSPIRLGQLAGRDVALLARHGHEHTIPPSQINNRANIWALKELGCEQVLTTAACGSLRAEMDRGHFVIPDQFIDFTRHRATTFFDAFEPGVMNARHAPMADPFDATLRTALVKNARALGFPVHDGGTILTIRKDKAMKKLICSLSIMGLFAIGTSSVYAESACTAAKESTPACSSKKEAARDAGVKKDCSDASKATCSEKKKGCGSEKKNCG